MQKLALLFNSRVRTLAGIVVEPADIQILAVTDDLAARQRDAGKRYQQA